MLSFVNVCPVRSIHIQGIIITLFFQCLNALLNPVNRPGTGIKWSFVAHTIAMFSFVTVIIVMCLGVLPICYIDNREFPGGYFPVPGPLGYYASLYSNPIDIVPKVMFLLNYCLADGLLVSAISNQPLRMFNAGRSPALSLLHYLWKELLGHRLPLPDVYHILRYVLEAPQTVSGALGSRR